MKKFLGIALIILALIIIGAVLFTRERQKPLPGDATPTPKAKIFTWGVTSGPYQLDGYKTESADKQIALLKDLGVSTVRISVERKLTLDPFKIEYADNVNDDFIDRLSKNGIDIALIIDGDIIGTATTDGFDQEAEGYKMGSYIAKRYKGKVKYYQTANEVTGTIVKPADPNFKGETFQGEFGVQYSTDRYNSTLKWIKGIGRGIRENDPAAKIVITGHWILTDIISRLQKDGAQFDIIGWAWYSPDGTDMTKRERDGGEYNLLARLQEFKKPVWVIESNRDKGSYSVQNANAGELEQSQFIKQFTKTMLANSGVSGYFVYPLQDTPPGVAGTAEKDGHWGIVAPKLLNGQVEYTRKSAFFIYKEIIQSNNF